jgi:DNA-directed RNA polymerase specialized sigma24 family protein
MSTTASSSSATAHARDASTDRKRLEADFADLVAQASTGDRRAIGALGMALGPALLEEASHELGIHREDADIVLQDFFLVLLARRWRYEPASGDPLAWMAGIIRALARRQCRERGL